MKSRKTVIADGVRKRDKVEQARRTCGVAVSAIIHNRISLSLFSQVMSILPVVLGLPLATSAGS